MKKVFTSLFILSIAMLGCQSPKTEVTLILGAYTIPKEVYQENIIPAFQKYWYKKTGQHVKFEESYVASGSQSRAIAAGFEADIAALSLEADIDRLKDAGLITHDWRNQRYNGFVTRSVVVIVFRPGNPKNIKDWEDLTRENINVLHPNPETSGGAMWGINAIYGAGLKLSEVSSGTPDKDYAKQLLRTIKKNVKAMSVSGRVSIIVFEKGVGDALITYEEEAILRKKRGREVEYVIPDATILIENPIAIIDKNVEKHENRPVAEAFVEFVLSKDAQRAFAEYGFRPIDEEVASEFSHQFPQPKYLFDINYLGGWDTVHESIFGANGVWTQIMEEMATDIARVSPLAGAVSRRIDFNWGKAKKDETGNYMGRRVTVRGQGFIECQKVIVTVMSGTYDDHVGPDGTFSESPGLIVSPGGKVTVEVDGTTGSDKCPSTGK